jgi:hypothetical protein
MLISPVPGRLEDRDPTITVTCRSGPSRRRAWLAIEAGGPDNITMALARLGT